MSRVTEIRRALAALAEGSTVAPGPTEYAPGNGLDRCRFDVLLLVGPSDDEDAQARLDELIAPSGLKELLERDRSLGGLVSDLAVARCSGWQIHRRAGGEQLGATWSVDVLT